MIKVLAGLVAAVVIAVAGFFGFEYYLQKQIENEVRAAFLGALSAREGTAAQATLGKVGFDLWSRTITVAGMTAMEVDPTTKPTWSIKIGRFTASGVSRPDAGRFAADRIEIGDVEVGGAIVPQSPLRVTYKAPRIEVASYSGPAGPLRQVDPKTPGDVHRFIFDHFAAISAASVTAPSITGSVAAAPANIAGTGEYGYSGVALRNIRDGKIAAITIDRVTFAAAMQTAGKTEKMTGEVADLAAFDFDATAAFAMFDPARANDDKVYRAYREMKAGVYSGSFESGLKFRIDGMTASDIGIRPSKVQLSLLLAIVAAAPPPGATPTPQQTRDMFGKIATLYEGILIGSTEVRGLALDMPEGPFRLATIKLSKLENGKLAEFAMEGLDARSPQGPVKIGRFALKSLDLANLLRVSAEFAGPGRNPSPDQLAALLLLLEGTEVSGLVAPYKDTDKPVNIDTLNLSWGQFVGPIPTRARVTLKMSGPLDENDPDPFNMLAAAGINTGTINFDLGAAWAEGTRSFALEPATLEIGSVLTAALRMSLSNVPREVFSVNPLQAAIMAAQIEAGPMELVLRDTGGVDLAVAQYARAQNVTREVARRAIVDAMRANGMQMASVNPDAMAITGALTRLFENPRGTATIKLTPKGKVPMMQLIEAMRIDPLAALARFQVEVMSSR